VMPIVIRSGSVGIVWPRLRDRYDPGSAIAQAMETAFQAQVQHNARVERDIARVVTRLRDHGVDPILVKGWAVARQYPPGLVRPAGDIDLVVREDAYERATALISELDREAATVGVDLKHPSIWEERPSDDPWHETHEVTADGVPVRELDPGLDDPGPRWTPGLEAEALGGDQVDIPVGVAGQDDHLAACRGLVEHLHDAATALRVAEPQGVVEDQRSSGPVFCRQ